jgi:ankyrin repeat protein
MNDGFDLVTFTAPNGEVVVFRRTSDGGSVCPVCGHVEEGVVAWLVEDWDAAGEPVVEKCAMCETEYMLDDRVESVDPVGALGLRWEVLRARWMASEGATPDVVEPLRNLGIAWGGLADPVGETRQLAAERVGVNERDAAGWTPLIRAAVYGWTESVAVLLGAGADVEVRDEEGWTALIWASALGDDGVVERLLRAGADREARTKAGATALWWAARNCHALVVETLLEAGAEVSVRDGNGSSVLMWSSAKGCLGVVRLLVEAWAEVDAVTSGKKMTPLLYAAEGGHLAVVRHLLAAGARLDVRDAKGRTALALAEEEGHEDVVRWLREAGASGCAPNNRSAM